MSLLERFDRVAVVAGDDEDTRALRERLHDFAGEAENRGLVCRAMAGDEGASAVRQRVEDAAQCCAEPLGVLGDELGVGVPQRRELAASRLLVRQAPAILDFRPQPGLDDDPARHLPAERREETREGLRRALGAGRDGDVVTAAEACADRQRGSHTFGGENVAVGVGVPPELDLLAHGATLTAAVQGSATIGDVLTVSLPRAELERRAAEAHELLGERCVVCPRGCKVDRRADVAGLCAIGRHAVVASYFPHFGEEDCLRGHRGSGTIFFSGCNLRCVFCQNHDISWQVRGELVTPQRLAGMMLELQAIGCHNINWVTPEHVVPQILEALPLAFERGLDLPIVYNTSAYDSLDSLHLLEGIVDVYMPDFKLWTSEAARRYLKRADYTDVARETIVEMNRQVGDLVLDEHGMARRGLILRHLIMPGLVEETESILRFVAEELGPGTYVNLMAQYYVSGKVGENGQYEEIARGIHREEYEQALALARELGLRLDPRSVGERRRLARAV
jgi:putative pyruvate formate lyase activating enzyme